MSFEESERNETSRSENGDSSEREEKEMCRDFKKGDCRRGQRCIYFHPKLEVCRDFQNRECTWRGCKYVHVTKSEEEKFDGSGILPPHVTNGPFPPDNQKRPRDGSRDGPHNSLLGKRGHSAMSGQGPAPMYGQRENPSDVCRDFEKGDCRRGSRCKFYHPKLVICRDFQKDKCDRDNCRFLHMTQEEENTYEGNGIVPDHIDKDMLRKNRLSAPPAERDRGGSGDMYGKRRPDMRSDSAYPATAYPPAATGGFAAGITLEAALQENAMLKLKQVEMQQQITDLRRMNDTLYEQNQAYRNQQTF